MRPTLNHTHWDIARYANTMAVRTNITIDPTKITPRIKNKLLKWLTNLHLDGGHRSEARKLGEMLGNKFQLPLIHNTWWGLRLSATNKQMGAQLAELFQADFTGALLGAPHLNGGWYREQYDKARMFALRAHGEPFDVRVYDEEYKRRILDVVRKHISEEELSRVQQAIEAITGTEPINVINFQ